MRVGAVQPHRHIAGHLVGAADQWQPVAAVQVAVVLVVLIGAVGVPFDDLDRIGPAGGDQRGRLAVRVGQVRQDHRAALRVADIGPMRHGRLQRAA